MNLYLKINVSVYLQITDCWVIFLSFIDLTISHPLRSKTRVLKQEATLKAILNFKKEK